MAYPQTVEEFKSLVGEVQARDSYRPPMLYAIGNRVVTPNGTVASVRYPVVNGPGQNTGTAAILMKVLGISPHGVQSVALGDEAIREVLKHFVAFRGDGKRHPNVEALAFTISAIRVRKLHMVATFIFDDVIPEGVDDSTLKLYGLSCRLFKPNELNLTKIFTKLPNVAWVGDNPRDADTVEQDLLGAAFGQSEFAPNGVDKFPLYVHRINAVKLGVRIVDGHSVRLGAYLGEGTTVMPGGYINFNAGTEGASMVEGLIASSAEVGSGSDIGNGARTIGVLSGGNSRPISVGRNCLLELNAMLGIPVGDAVIIAAGAAVMAGSLVQVRLPSHPLNGCEVKAIQLADINAVTFRRNDRGGQLEVVRTQRNEEFARKLADGETILNKDLHVND